MFDERESFAIDGGPIATLASDALVAQLRGLVGEERRIQAAFLVRLDELDRRRAYLDAGYGSLWEWCLRDLHLSEGAAGRRITAMRVIRRFPRVLDGIRDGRLSLSSSAALGPVLTEENHHDLLARAAYKSKSEVDHLVASVRPREAPKGGIRKLPPGAPASLPAAAGVAAPAAPDPAPFVTERLAVAPEPAAAPDEQSRSASAIGARRGMSAEIAPPPGRIGDQRRVGRAEIRPVAEDQWSVRVTFDTISKQELELLQHLLSHKCGRDLAGVLREAIRCGIEKHGKRRGAVPTRRRKPGVSQADVSPLPPTITSPARRRESGNDAIPAAVKQAVYDRDGGCCAFVSADGRRCGSKWKLEFDHVHSAFLDGPATIDNIRLACRAPEGSPRFTLVPTARIR